MQGSVGFLAKSFPVLKNSKTSYILYKRLLLDTKKQRALYSTTRGSFLQDENKSDWFCVFSCAQSMRIICRNTWNDLLQTARVPLQVAKGTWFSQVHTRPAVNPFTLRFMPCARNKTVCERLVSGYWGAFPTSTQAHPNLRWEKRPHGVFWEDGLHYTVQATIFSGCYLFFKIPYLWNVLFWKWFFLQVYKKNP